MDRYIAKPIRAEELLETIADIRSDAKSVPPPVATSSGDVVNWCEALKLVRGNRTLLKSMAEAALAEVPRLAADIHQAVGDRDHAKLRFSAHALKGELRYFVAGRACDCAARLESMGHEGNLENAEATLGVLETEIAKVTAALLEYVQRE